MFHWLQGLKRRTRDEKNSLLQFSEGFLPPSQDTFAAIGELSRVVRNNPDAVEIYLALGNLFRSQGEIERAIQIRTNLIARPQLNEQFKARAWFELGIDFKRAGILDRAHAALEQAHRITGDDPAILKEMARLYADTNDFDRAAKYYSLLGQPLAQAHYMVKDAGQAARNGDENSAYRLIHKAIRVYPGSVEAWLEIICRDYELEQWNNLQANLKKALELVKDDLRFVLLEGLYQFIRKRSPDQGHDFINENCSRIIVETLGSFEQSLIFCYYCSIFLKESGKMEQTREWLEKSLVMDPEFWPARLEILDITQQEQIMTESFKTQLGFFTRKARMVKRFVCRRCGLKREQLFYLCPRCYSWHSISFRTLLNE
ncbi:tetratricopeptide repeat protein [Desulfonatronovibrio hydrogenovorans]|uniref:tetratricopeptide repeat protein n=1 Tax=Desulfonatronovibrio hydrogenovorans TaxID=53245 RepID=UPI000490504F|nr:tetratricopeptide repeat protein [Desulfonatronovibrio hydrogenovorans]